MKEQGKQHQPMLISLGLLTDVLISQLCLGLILLLALNMSINCEQMEVFERFPFIGSIFAKYFAGVMVLGLFTSVFIWITAMFGGIYTITILFGNKSNWTCCPGLNKTIKRELLGSPIEDKVSEV